MFDRQFFDCQRTAFGDKRMVRYLSLLIEELAQRSTAIDAAERRDDRGGLAENAHAVASVAVNLGFAALVTIGRRLEHEIGSMPADRIAPCLDELRETIGATIVIARGLTEELATAGAGSDTATAVC